MRRTFAFLVLVCLLLVALAGCAQSPASDRGAGPVELGQGRSVKSVNRTAIEQRLNRSIATSGDPKLGDWYVLSAAAGPEGNLTGFRFVIPDGSLVPPRYGFGSPLLSLEVVPIVTGDVAIEEWAFIPIVLEQGRARLTRPQAAYIPPPYDEPFLLQTHTKTLDLALPNPRSSETSASLAPHLAVYADEQLRTPGIIFFVVAARAATAVPFGLAIRVLDHVPAPQERPPSSLDEFLDSVGRATPFGLPTTGRATGFAAAIYRAETALPLNGTQPISHIDVRAGAVKVDNRVDQRSVPGLTARDATISSGLDTQEGWTYAYASYGAYCSTGKWSAKIEAHGKSFAPRSLVLQHIICGAIYGYIAALLLLGVPQFTFQHEGAGSASVSFDIQTANAGVEQLRYRHLSLGATMQRLIGHGAFGMAVASTGLVGNVPPGEDASAYLVGGTEAPLHNP